MEKIPVLAVVGATASGKTALAVRLAKELNGEVVSADSMQIYKKMDIGTAKPTAEEMDGVIHHLIDIAEPWEDFSVAKYCSLAHDCILDIHRRGKLPVMAGGTGFYVDSVLYDIQYTDMEKDEALRSGLEELARREGNAAVYALLQEKDPPAASRLHPNDLKRVIRALEIITVTGESIIEHERRSRLGGSRYKPCFLAIDWPRQTLYERIDRRVDLMLEAGLLKEVAAVYNALPRKDCTAMQGLGYKEFIPYLAGACTLEEATETLKRDTRRFAKRQLTWFRRNKQIHWISPETEDFTPYLTFGEEEEA